MKREHIIVGVMVVLFMGALACAGGVPTGSSSDGTLTYGDTTRGTIDYNGERDSWTFEGQEGDIINIAMVGQARMDDTYLELYGPNGNELTRDDDSGQGLNSLISGYVLPETGTYRIIARAYGSDTGPYEISLSLTQVREIAYGETVNGRITLSEPQHSWVFEGEAGDVVTISMIGQVTLTDTYLELYGPSGSQVTYNDDGGDGLSSLIEGFTLPETGSYVIVARPYSEGVGPYELGLARIEIHDIAYDETQNGELSSGEPATYWHFQGNAWDVITITLEGDGPANDTSMELYDPNGAILTQSALVDGLPTISAYALLQTGVYRVEVHAGSGEGSYDITLARTTLQPRTISPEQAASGALTEENAMSLWSFEGEVGDAVSISVEGEGQTGSVSLGLYGPDNHVIAHEQSPSQQPSVMLSGYALPLGGDYRILVEAVDGYTGSYEIMVSPAEIQVGAITYGQALTGELTDEEPQQSWHFEGQAGDVVTISMVGLGGNLSDTYLELYAPNGEWLTSDDDGGDGLSSLVQNYELPYTGSYEIVARPYSTGTGAYEIALGRVEYHSRTTTYISYGDVLSGEITESYLREYWFFEGDAGDIVTITMTGQGDFQDVFMELTGPDGATLVGVTEDSICAITHYALPVSGAYHLVTTSLEGGLGGYELALAGQ